MNTKEESNHFIKLRIVALAQRIVIISLVGIVAIIFSGLMFGFDETIALASVVISFVFIAFLWFYVPLLEIYTIAIIYKKWKAITINDDKEDERNISRIAGNLLAAAFLSALISLLPVIFIVIFGRITMLRFLWSFLIVIIGSVFGIISLKLYKKIPGQFVERITSALSVVVCLAAITLTIHMTGYSNYLIQHLNYAKKVPTYSGSTESLNQTIVVPTLDSPIEENKNVIWSSVFQLALNELPDDVTNVFSEVLDSNNIAIKSYYTAVGKVSDRIFDVIRNDMAENFPKYSILPLSYSYDLIVYSYLDLHVPFKYHFPEYKDGFEFTDSQGKQTNISAFGVWEPSKYDGNISEQVTLLYSSLDPNEYKDGKHVKEFAIDLCKYSDPYQVIVSVVEPNETLSKTIEYIEKKIEDFKSSEDPSNRPEFIGYDILLVPEMFWQINHKFQDIQNVDAYQEISLKFDRGGAVKENKSAMVKRLIMRRFECDRPFMLYIKKRGSTQPCFVMWIDNAELLNKN